MTEYYWKRFSDIKPKECGPCVFSINEDIFLGYCYEAFMPLFQACEIYYDFRHDHFDLAAGLKEPEHWFTIPMGKFKHTEEILPTEPGDYVFVIDGFYILGSVSNWNCIYLNHDQIDYNCESENWRLPKGFKKPDRWFKLPSKDQVLDIEKNSGPYINPNLLGPMESTPEVRVSNCTMSITWSWIKCEYDLPTKKRTYAVVLEDEDLENPLFAFRDFDPERGWLIHRMEKVLFWSDLKDCDLIPDICFEKE